MIDNVLLRGMAFSAVGAAEQRCRVLLVHGLFGSGMCLHDKTTGPMRSSIPWYLPTVIDSHSMLLRNALSVV